MRLGLCRYAVLALLVMGSASLLSSCDSKPATTVYDYETLMTESSENRTITMMENGKRSYTFVSPLMEGYSMASNPYQEFRRGIKMTTYTDSLSLVDATITANYAIYYERQKLWEAKGNVVIIKNNRKEGDTTITGLTEIYTQQLFWNATTKKIYSNVDTKVLQPDGWHFGVGFDADDDLKNIHFRKYTSEMEFDMSQPTPEERAAKQQEKSAKESEKDAKKDAKEDAKGDTKENKQKKAPAENRRTPNAKDAAKLPAAQHPGSNRSGVVDHNLSPLPVGHNDRSEASLPTKREGASTQPATPSMGNRPGGKPANLGSKGLNAKPNGTSTLNAGASAGKRVEEPATPAK